MGLVDVGIGQLFWTTLAFGMVLFILSKYAWKPIMKSLHEREDSIEDALSQAEKARQEIQNLQAENEKLLNQAREERDKILQEARDLRKKLLEDAKSAAEDEGKRQIALAKKDIEAKKMEAVHDMKNMIAKFSIEIAEKILREKLDDDAEQKKFINKLLDEVKLN